MSAIDSAPPEGLSVAIIGSFRQHYDAVLECIGTFVEHGVRVTSPKRSRVIDPSQDFVRFELDDPSSSDVEIQYQALVAILRASCVFVVCPDGYVGRTTCYEIGRAHQATIPIFYSAMPRDLPIPVPSSSVMSAEDLGLAMADSSSVPVIDTSDISQRIKQHLLELLIIGLQRSNATRESHAISHERARSLH